MRLSIILSTLIPTITAADLCRIEVGATHSFGGGGPGQGLVDTFTSKVLCFDRNNNLLWSEWRSADGFVNVETNIPMGPCRVRIGDLTVSTSWNSANGDYEICKLWINSQRGQGGFFDAGVPGEKSTSSQSGSISNISGKCTWEYNCLE